MKEESILMERLLEFIEDTLWLANTYIANFGKEEGVGNLPKSSDLREALTKNDHGRAMEIFHTLADWKGQWSQVMSEHIALFAADIVDWYFGSKRIFQISENLEEMLLQTDLPEFVPSEVRFVADSFAVRVEKPISIGDRGRTYDFIVCTQDPVAHTLTAHAFPTGLNSYSKLTATERQSLTQKAKRHAQGFIDKVSSFFDEAHQYVAMQGFNIDPAIGPGKTYRQLLVEMAEPDESTDGMLEVFQLALGTNLYVQTVRKDDTETCTKVPVKRTERGTNITSGADIFTFSSSYILHRKSESDNDSGQSDKSVRPHFRRGFWRRPKGFGQDPNAKATEWVRPTWVRPDKIMDGEIPLGTLQTSHA